MIYIFLKFFELEFILQDNMLKEKWFFEVINVVSGFEFYVSFIYQNFEFILSFEKFWNLLIF